jgi:hypothetical protein
MTKQVFYSFHYQSDAWRVQMVRNMGALEGQPILNPQKWEEVKQQGDAAIKQWIAEKMTNKSAVVVLVGAQTAGRRWVTYEIEYAWTNYKPLVGIRIHGLEDANGNTDIPGPNPFAKVSLKNGKTVADYVPLYTPDGSSSRAVHADISMNLTTWVDNAKKRD